MNPSKENLSRQAEALAPWLMRHQLAPGLYTPVMERCASEKQAEYDPERARIIFDFLETAGAIAGQEVLDLGCASGFYSFAALERGAARALGVDLRPRHVEQARFLAGLYGREEQVRFEQEAIEGWLDHGKPVDLLLCLDTLQYLTDPIATLARLRPLVRKALVLDMYLTPPEAQVLYPDPGGRDLAKWALLGYSPTKHQKHGAHGWTVTPSPAALTAMLASAGFAKVVGLKPPPEWASDTLPLGRYNRLERRIMVAFPQEIALNEAAREMSYDLALDNNATVAGSASGGRLGRAVQRVGALRFLPWLGGRALARLGSSLQAWAERTGGGNGNS